MRMIYMVLMIVVSISGYPLEGNMDRAAVITKVLAQVPKCTGDLETINDVVEVKEHEQDFTVIIRQDCEPKHGEGPQMRTTYTYAVTPHSDVRLVEKKNGF